MSEGCYKSFTNPYRMWMTCLWTINSKERYKNMKNSGSELFPAFSFALCRISLSFTGNIIWSIFLLPLPPHQRLFDVSTPSEGCHRWGFVFGVIDANNMWRRPISDHENLSDNEKTSTEAAPICDLCDFLDSQRQPFTEGRSPGRIHSAVIQQKYNREKKATPN